MFSKKSIKTHVFYRRGFIDGAFFGNEHFLKARETHFLLISGEKKN